ncbi:MAG: phospholipid/cholesterol/gamma-HCH transport system permease protein [Thermodesulfobacteriota bacterium]|nr:phospholipid/cholesterol/gamma-HCH transport system permease protein [Thermodesulfobacteriota bacterium]
MTAIIEQIGRSGLHVVHASRATLTFAFHILARMFDLRAYNSAVRMVLINQIYFTSIQILPLFLSVAVISGAIVIGMIGQYLTNLGLFGYFGQLLMGFVVSEFAPFITVLLIALRSSSAVNAEIAVMKVNKELNTLNVFRIDVINYLFLPRILCDILSVVLLSWLFSIVVLTSGLVFSALLFNMSINDYVTVLLTSAKFSDIIVMLIKCATMGFFIIMIPIRYGMRATDELTSIPVSVLQGMVNVFIAIMIIEVVSLIVMSLIEKLI